MNRLNIALTRRGLLAAGAAGTAAAGRPSIFPPALLRRPAFLLLLQPKRHLLQQHRMPERVSMLQLRTVQSLRLNRSRFRMHKG